MSASSLNIEVVAGSGPPGHPEIWKIKREDWSVACIISDNAALKDCTANGAHPGRIHFRIGGNIGSIGWVPVNALRTCLQEHTHFRSYVTILVLAVHIKKAHGLCFV